MSVLPNHRVLIVDDNQDAAKTLGLLLKLLGAEVEIVNDGPSALKILSSYRPTVVLLDIGMPGMDGYEVARQIRKQPEGHDIILVAVTWGCGSPPLSDSGGAGVYAARTGAYSVSNFSGD